jgi:hypothetical protein
MKNYFESCSMKAGTSFYTVFPLQPKPNGLDQQWGFEEKISEDTPAPVNRVTVGTLSLKTATVLRYTTFSVGSTPVIGRVDINE